MEWRHRVGTRGVRRQGGIGRDDGHSAWQFASGGASGARDTRERQTRFDADHFDQLRAAKIIWQIMYCIG